MIELFKDDIEVFFKLEYDSQNSNCMLPTPTRMDVICNQTK